MTGRIADKPASHACNGMVASDLKTVPAIFPIGSQVYEYLGAFLNGVNHSSSLLSGCLLFCIVCSKLNLVCNRSQGQEIFALILPLVQSHGRRLDRAVLPPMKAGAIF